MSGNDLTTLPHPAPESTGRVRTVLLVEDDRVTLMMLRFILEDAGFSVLTAEDVTTMRRILAVDTVDLAVLDLSLPDGNALDALIDLPEATRPRAICMSSDSCPDVRVDALRRGASDFVVKPVVECELIARLNLLDPMGDASAPGHGAPQASGHIACAGWVIDPGGQRVQAPDGQDLDLTSGEFRLLIALVRNPGRPLSREWLTETVIGRPWRAEDRSIDVMVGRLRRKMDLTDDGPLRISSVRYLGYRLDIGA
ncbi:MAG: response regulator transcription factor [Rhodospirillaceae bacterium]